MLPLRSRGTVLTEFAIIAFIIMSLPILLATVILQLFSLSTIVAAKSAKVGHGATQLASCPDYSSYSREQHEPYSSGKLKLPSQRPSPECRTFKSQEVEDLIVNMKTKIKDPDLYKLFENAYPNTLDTAIRWKGHAADNNEDLTFMITGDIDAMWIRDSANQLQSYLSVLKPSEDKNSLASLYRGVINLQARYLTLAPYCNSFQPPVAASIPLVINTGATTDTVTPPPEPKYVWECKYELDSIASFLQVSSEYYKATKDWSFFSKGNWAQAVNLLVQTAEDMKRPTYDENGRVLPNAYTFQRTTTRATETLSNDGLGNPVAAGTSLVRSAFRPSDDSTIYQLLIPANMMFSRYLSSTADIMAQIKGQEELANKMRTFSKTIRQGIMEHGTVQHPKFGKIFAYEVDGFGSTNTMDDANIPSLLSAPHLGFISANDTVYQNTRKFVLSSSNPYFMRGTSISSVGGPHVGPGWAWPMANIVRILTSDDDGEITKTLKEILSTTSGLGLIHESVNDSFEPPKYTRQWYVTGFFSRIWLTFIGFLGQMVCLDR